MLQKMGLDSEDYFIQLWHETENGELGKQMNPIVSLSRLSFNCSSNSNTLK